MLETEIEEYKKKKIKDFFYRKVMDLDKIANKYIKKKADKLGTRDYEALESMWNYNKPNFENDGNRIWREGTYWKYLFSLYMNRAMCYFCKKLVKESKSMIHHIIYDFNAVFSKSVITHKKCHSKKKDEKVVKTIKIKNQKNKNIQDKQESNLIDPKPLITKKNIYSEEVHKNQITEYSKNTHNKIPPNIYEEFANLINLDGNNLIIKSDKKQFKNRE